MDTISLIGQIEQKKSQLDKELAQLIKSYNSYYISHKGEECSKKKDYQLVKKEQPVKFNINNINSINSILTKNRLQLDGLLERVGMLISRYESKPLSAKYIKDVNEDRYFINKRYPNWKRLYYENGSVYDTNTLIYVFKFGIMDWYIRVISAQMDFYILFEFCEKLDEYDSNLNRTYFNDLEKIIKIQGADKLSSICSTVEDAFKDDLVQYRISGIKIRDKENLFYDVLFINLLEDEYFKDIGIYYQRYSSVLYNIDTLNNGSVKKKWEDKKTLYGSNYYKQLKDNVSMAQEIVYNHIKQKIEDFIEALKTGIYYSIQNAFKKKT